MDIVTDENLTCPGQGRKPGGDIDRVAEGGHVIAIRTFHTDSAHKCDPGVKTDTYRDPRTTDIGVPCPDQQVLGGPKTFGRMVRAPQWEIESNDLVTNRLVEKRIAVDQDLGAGSIEALHQGSEFAWP